MLPLAGSSSTDNTYNIWLDQLSIIHQNNKPHKVSWFIKWKDYYDNNLNPQEAFNKAKEKYD